ncbi:BTB/POZ domain-containing protein 2-like isoform X2 [Mytilus galloprovincialis]
MDNQKKEPDDWRKNKTLQDCMLYMLQNEIMCDVTFRVGESRKMIKAHKNILASRSQVFHTMFEGSLPEKGEISIPDIDEDTFSNLLLLAYDDDVLISNKNVDSMLYAGDKYMLSTVMSKCSEFLISTAKSADAVVTLSTARQFHLEDLQTESLKYIEDNTAECLSSIHAVELNSQCVQLILKSEYLSCSETDVCNFFLKWITNQCQLQDLEVNAENLRSISGELMSLIRFPLIEKKYFSTTVSHSMLLTTDEILSVFRWHHGEVCSLFSTDPRCPRGPNLQGETKIIHRHTRISNGWRSNAANALIFHSNKSIWLKGCIIFAPLSVTCGGNAKFTFELTDESTNIFSNEVLDMESGTSLNETIGVSLTKPILLNAEKRYTIVVRDIKPTTYYGSNCKSVCKQDDVTITFQNSTKSKCSTDITQGQIAGIMFCL